jgi:hypothetical protein
MAELRECGNCGKEFRPSREKDLWCFPCELVLQAVEPPEMLRDMRIAYRNQIGGAGTDGQRRMRQLFEDDVIKFTDRMTKLEDQYRAACIRWEATRRMEAAPNKWDGEGQCPACGRGDGITAPVKDLGTAELIGKVEAWMSKQPGGGG